MLITTEQELYHAIGDIFCYELNDRHSEIIIDFNEISTGVLLMEKFANPFRPGWYEKEDWELNREMVTATLMGNAAKAMSGKIDSQVLRRKLLASGSLAYRRKGFYPIYKGEDDYPGYINGVWVTSRPKVAYRFRQEGSRYRHKFIFTTRDVTIDGMTYRANGEIRYGDHVLKRAGQHSCQV